MAVAGCRQDDQGSFLRVMPTSVGGLWVWEPHTGDVSLEEVHIPADLNNSTSEFKLNSCPKLL